METKYSFYIDDFAVDLKQHINLSDNARLVIDEDIRNFYSSTEKESFSGFLNQIFTNFYQKSIASIDLRLLEKKEELEKIYNLETFKKTDKKTIDLFIEKYCEDYREKLIEQVLSYEKGSKDSYDKIRVNKRNLEILRDSENGEYYDGSIGKYLKAIFEEYSLKPSFIREQIFFANTLDNINKAIARNVKLKIVLNEKVTSVTKRKYSNKYYLSPYKIVQDKTNTFNYVVGYSQKIIEKIEIDEKGQKRKTSITLEKEPACFRISRIAKSDIQISMGSKITSSQSKELEEMLIKRTAMYMSGEVIGIKVKFTEKGLESLKRQIYMRPQFYDIDKEDKCLYTFYCTRVQAINYFFKFGWDAMIVSPEELKEEFKIRYSRSMKSYEGMSKLEIIESEQTSNEYEKKD